MKFRKDINGLRAFAVVAVVLFHFNSSWMPGGFAGVDVFFVISGFLMTGIIFRGMEQDKFSVLNFYVARANRIIPALALLCLVLLVFGWFYLTPLEYKALGKHAASSVGFLSNFVYWREAGYFDAASHEKWLLHTWSLSVEWQFYIIYPLVLIALRKFLPIKTLKLLLIIGTVLGFIFSVVATYKSPNAAYYLFPTRAWEMMIGGVAYLYPFTLQENRKKLIEWAGLILVIGSYFLISAENLWPGYLAIFPVLGSFLIIQAQRNDSLITGNIIFQKLGAWSYSIYLWHWPFVVAIYTFSLPSYYIYIGMILSVLLGFLSYKYVEKINFPRSFPTLLSYLKCKPIYIAGIIGVIGSGLFLTNGFEEHYPNNVLLVSNEANNKNPYNCMTENKFPCYIGEKDNIKAIIVGDSHADALTTSLASMYDLRKEGIIALTRSSCPFILDIKILKQENECLAENLKRRDFLNKNYLDVPIFWVARTGAYLYGQTDPSRINDIQDTLPSMYFTKKFSSVEPALLSELEENLEITVKDTIIHRPMYLVLPTSEMRFNVPKVMSKELLLNKKVTVPSISEEQYLKRNKPIIEIFNRVAANNKIKVLDPTKYMCSNKECKGLHEGRPIYYDGDHMSEYGNKLLTPMFKEAGI